MPKTCMTETEMNIQESSLEEAGAWSGQTEERILALHYPAVHVALLSSLVGGLGPSLGAPGAPCAETVQAVSGMRRWRVARP